jgi:hypothetical protein
MNFNGYCDLSISNKQLKLSKCEVESILSEGEYMTIKFMDYSNLLFVMRESDFKLYIDDSMEQ